MPEWNPTVLKSRIIHRIDSHTDITYQVSASAAGGMVKSRDFINLRCYAQYLNGEPLLVDTRLVDARSPPTCNVSPLKNGRNIKKSHSDETLLHGGSLDDGGREFTHTLSKSLGAKQFIGIEQDDDDDFEDASDINEDEIMYICSAISVPYEELPPSQHFIRFVIFHVFSLYIVYIFYFIHRGENRLSSWATREVAGQRNVCTFEWLLCLDLKGSFPRYILENAYTTMMQDYMVYLRKYCSEHPDLLDD